jgi:dihydrofolate reductase
MLLSAIVAVGANGEIGQDGSLPWPRLEADMKRFRKVTVGKPIIMGRRTWDMLPVRPLPARPNIVLTTRWPGPSGPYPSLGCDVAKSADEALEAAGLYASRGDGPEAVVIGGARAYRLFWPQIRRLYVTRIHAAFPDADTVLDLPLPPRGWRELAYAGMAREGGVEMTFHVYDADEIEGG